jgi:hypothetical protein
MASASHFRPFQNQTGAKRCQRGCTLHRGADLEADLTLRVTHELALRQDAILQFQRIDPREARPQSQGNEQSAVQP